MHPSPTSPPDPRKAWIPFPPAELGGSVLVSLCQTRLAWHLTSIVPEIVTYPRVQGDLVTLSSGSAATSLFATSFARPASPYGKSPPSCWPAQCSSSHSRPRPNLLVSFPTFTPLPSLFCCCCDSYPYRGLTPGCPFRGGFEPVWSLPIFFVSINRGDWHVELTPSLLKRMFFFHDL